MYRILTSPSSSEYEIAMLKLAIKRFAQEDLDKSDQRSTEDGSGLRNAASRSSSHILPVD